jgi:hypothetical protein
MIHKSLQVIREDELIVIHFYKMPASPGGTIVNSHQMGGPDDPAPALRGTVTDHRRWI